METETLSSYEQPQDKHILDGGMDVDLPRDDEESDSLESKENSEVNSTAQHKEIINDDTEALKDVGICQSSENKENGNDCDQSFTNSEDFLENKRVSNNCNEVDHREEERELIESEDTNKNVSENCEQSEENLTRVNIYNEENLLSAGGKGLLGDKENELLNEEDRDSSDSEDKESLNEDEKLILSDEDDVDKDLFSDDEPDEPSHDEEKDPLNDELSHDEEKIERVLVDDEENDRLEGNQKSDDPLNAESKKSDDPLEAENQSDDPLGTEDQISDDPLGAEGQISDDPLSAENQSDDPLGAENQTDDPLCAEDQTDNMDIGEENKNDGLLDEESKKDDHLAEENKNDDPLAEEKHTDDVSGNDDEESEKNDPLQQEEKPKENQLNEKGIESRGEEKENEKMLVDVAGDTEKETVPNVAETNENEKHLKDKESADIAGETNENKPISENNKESSKEPLEDKVVDKNHDVIKDCPLLKESLTKVNNKNDGEQQKEADMENGLEDMDMDDDFDPSLLCPDIAMEVDEAPVITNNDNAANDGNKSPLLYEPFFCTYVDEMTGAEVSFNLTPEEQQLRQQTYGEDNPIQYTKVHCTACNVHLGSALDGQSNRFVHPLLKVLICKDCYHFYTSGEFEKDEDGSELYCRWCGQGGQVMCCSGCEMVFCKKCVRINFGRKKLAEIRDSDDWFCFRCNPSQLISLRVHCAEFMEYVRREISRAATLENATTFTTTDFSQCCLSQKKKYVEPSPSNEPKKKKRKPSVDPDYDPFREQDSPQPSTSGVKPPTTEPNLATTKPVPILPKPLDPAKNAGVVTQVSNPTPLIKVGNTTFRPRPVYQPRPRVQPVNVVSTGTVVRSTSGPGYIKIMPGGIRVTPTTSRTQTAQTFVSSSVRPQPPFHQRPPRPMGNPTTQMKHEWFEKTVRAAARVNSNLSYTLTQLNRAQATASSVEALAVVHNKLQEILSTSINSLIQIRKNLRTEFIAGIKNIRFPANKPPQQQQQQQPPPPPPPASMPMSAQDDDVIFVSPTPSPVPPPVTHLSSPLPPLSSIHLSPSVSLTKRSNPPPQGPSTSSEPIPSTSMLEKPKMFLRVKSLTALQNVPSECITIPDDPLPPPPPLTLFPQNQVHDVTIIDDSPEKNTMGMTIKDVTSVIETDPLQFNMEDKSKDDVEEKKRNDKMAENVLNGNNQSLIKALRDKMKNVDAMKVSYNLKDRPSRELKKMRSAKVYLKRSEKIDELVRKTFGLVNGNVSE